MNDQIKRTLFEKSMAIYMTDRHSVVPFYLRLGMSSEDAHRESRLGRATAPFYCWPTAALWTRKMKTFGHRRATSCWSERKTSSTIVSGLTKATAQVSEKVRSICFPSCPRRDRRYMLTIPWAQSCHPPPPPNVLSGASSLCSHNDCGVSKLSATRTSRLVGLRAI